MQYTIHGTTMPVVTLQVTSEEQIYTQSGGMCWMSDTFEMSTNMEGGIFGGLKRAMSGDSMFLTTYTCRAPQGIIAFACSFPGHIKPLELAAGESVICQKNAFLCAERTVSLEMHFRKQLGAGLFGGEGFIMQKVTGPGTAFTELSGEITEYTLQAGQVLKVDTGHVAMFDPTVSFDIEMQKGLKNMIFGGEGLFLARLAGPGRVWLQSMPIQNLAGRLIPFLPKSSN